MDDLTATTDQWGVETEYYDVFRRRYSASAETLTRLIAAMSAGGVAPWSADPPVDVTRAYQGDGRRLWGLAVQLYSVRSQRNWGHGDFGDLARLVQLAAACGAAAIGLNPLHALFADRAEQASPYAPNSRLFINPLYIDVEAIPEFPGLAAAGLESEVVALRETEMIAYARVAAAKLRGLRLAYARFRESGDEQRRADFRAYREEQGEPLLRFACFETLRRHHAPAPWTEWPQPWRNPERSELDAFRQRHEEEVGFEEFVQWNADRQLGSCMKAAGREGMPIGLYVDLAVGIDRHGADAWANHGAALAEVSIGAPADEFNPHGQDWGLAPLNPHVLPTHDFRTVRQLMAAAMRHAGAIRLDHVLGLQRLFMIPLGMEATQGAYVRMPFLHLLRVIAEESRKYRCIVIGEDLGTVPGGFRETISRWGLWCYRVMLFEREADGRFKPPEAYPEGALATFDTHDLPTFRGWLQKHDMAVKRELGLDPGESDDARAGAHRNLRDILAERASGLPSDDFAAAAAFLAATPSRLVVISLDDVLGVLDQVNIPGTTTEHPNWRRKLPLPLEDLENHAGLRRVAEVFAKAGRSI
jgi:4-alpha-glucanotransferase